MLAEFFLSKAGVMVRVFLLCIIFWSICTDAKYFFLAILLGYHYTIRDCLKIPWFKHLHKILKDILKTFRTVKPIE